jgi:hypothetical protein
VLGAGLVARVLRGYTFVSCNYVAGDSIVLVGFSRGAYTARALGGFITTVGLLDWRTLGLGPTGADEKAYLVWVSAETSRERAKPGFSGTARGAYRVAQPPRQACPGAQCRSAAHHDSRSLSAGSTGGYGIHRCVRGECARGVNMSRQPLRRVRRELLANVIS